MVLNSLNLIYSPPDFGYETYFTAKTINVSNSQISDEIWCFLVKYSQEFKLLISMQNLIPKITTVGTCLTQPEKCDVIGGCKRCVPSFALLNKKG